MPTPPIGPALGRRHVRSDVPAFLTAGSERGSLVETVGGLRRVVAEPAAARR